MAGFLYLFFLAGIMIPIQLDLVPLFALVHNLGISHSRLGIVCLYVAFAMPLTVFFYAGFLRTIPLEVEEAAEIDGCSQWRCYFQIVFPLLQPVTSTVFILQFLAVWNDFFLPVIFLNTPDLRTVQVAIYSFLGRYSNDWVHMFPILVLGMLPVLIIYLFLQKYIVSGIMAGSVKG
jgi:raffinose/stachyose/melibiose transport system permease protein